MAPLSAGLKRRVLLARALASDPDLLLLDEPTNHLDVDSIAWLEEFLRRQGRTLLFVTHDRAFLRRLATGILDLDRGRLTRWDADYDAYRDRKEEELATEARQDALFDKRLAQEEVWIRRGVRERRKRNQGRVRRLEDMRSTRGVRRELPGAVKIEAQAAAASGRLVVETKHLDFSWGDEPFVKDLSTTIMRGDRVGIVGPNGSGKTTLLQLLLGELQPAKGTVRLGVNLEIAYFDQLHNVLDDDASAADNVNHGRPTVEVNGKTRQVVSYLRDFLFTADQARGPIGAFSGGERARLALARLFARPSNVLVLDEPTNDLDLETLELLEDLLVDYPGTILLVSHDRELLDDVVTSTFVVEGRGVIHEYVGGYSDAHAATRRGGDAEARKRARPAKAPRPRSALDRTERQGAARPAGHDRAARGGAGVAPRRHGRPGLLQARGRGDRRGQGATGPDRAGAGGGLRTVGGAGVEGVGTGPGQPPGFRSGSISSSSCMSTRGSQGSKRWMNRPSRYHQFQMRTLRSNFEAG